MEAFEAFLEQFSFRPEGALLIGIERECFLANSKGEIKPIAPQVLNYLPDRVKYGYELSACQLEDRIGPCRIEEVKEQLLENEAEISEVEKKLGFKRLFFEVASDNMPLDIYPDPSGRYQKITQDMPREVLLAACRVIGTHVHIGMPNHDTAIQVYNRVLHSLDNLCRLGDGSHGQRLEIYKIVAPDFRPSRYANWQAFYQEAIVKKFISDPRQCWHLIRLSVHGTIEFRMFGVTDDLDKIVSWAQKCHSLCRQEV